MKERYNTTLEEYQANPQLDELTEKIIALCREYGVTLSHEDDHGAFEFEPPSEINEAWLRGAHDSTLRLPPEPVYHWTCKHCGYKTTSTEHSHCKKCSWLPMLVKGEEVCRS